jgi:hypothetical protein
MPTWPNRLLVEKFCQEFKGRTKNRALRARWGRAEPGHGAAGSATINGGLAPFQLRRQKNRGNNMKNQASAAGGCELPRPDEAERGRDKGDKEGKDTSFYKHTTR